MPKILLAPDPWVDKSPSVNPCARTWVGWQKKSVILNFNSVLASCIVIQYTYTNTKPNTFYPLAGQPGQKAWTEPERRPLLHHRWPCWHLPAPQSGWGWKQTAAPCSYPAVRRHTDAAVLLRSPVKERWWAQDPGRYPGWYWHLEPQRRAPGRWLEREDTDCDPSGSWLYLSV